MFGTSYCHCLALVTQRWQFNKTSSFLENLLQRGTLWTNDETMLALFHRDHQSTSGPFLQGITTVSVDRFECYTVQTSYHFLVNTLNALLGSQHSGTFSNNQNLVRVL